MAAPPLPSPPPRFSDLTAPIELLFYVAGLAANVPFKVASENIEQAEWRRGLWRRGHNGHKGSEA